MNTLYYGVKRNLELRICILTASMIGAQYNPTFIFSGVKRVSGFIAFGGRRGFFRIAHRTRQRQSPRMRHHQKQPDRGQSCGRMFLGVTRRGAAGF